jgi:outer membrane protein insertion porin family
LKPFISNACRTSLLSKSIIFGSLLALLSIFSVTLHAQSVRIGEILVEGNRKIEKDAIREKLISKEGQSFVSSQIREDIQAVFDMGYFLDVSVDRKQGPKGLTLVFKVLEKPSIVEIAFEGNSEESEDDLRETANLKQFTILDQAKLREAVEKIQKHYEEKGYFLAQITTDVKPVSGQDTVKVTFKIKENDMVKVKRISFIGNKRLSDDKLKSAMETKEGGFFSFMSGSGAFKQDAFDRDVQRLSFFYFNEGFVQAKVDRPQVSVSPDKKSIYISVRVAEGESFDIGQVDFSGDLLFSDLELSETTKIREGEKFSYQKLQNDLSLLTAKYGDLGYAFTNVIPRTMIRENDRLVDINFEIDKGNKVYLGQINVIGNVKTRDKVVRRELKIREGELYHETRKRESIASIRRLGFFEEVNFNTKTPDDDQTRLDIDIVVKERNTGTIQIGAGYSSFQGAVFNGQINQSNLFGRGQKLGASLDLGKSRSLFNLSFTEPYLLDTEWEAGFDLYQSRRTLPEYLESKSGGALRVGHPLAPYLTGLVRYKLDDTELTLDEDGSDVLMDEDGSDPLYDVDTTNGITSSLTFSLIYDKRNDRFAPTEGMYHSLSVEYAGLGGDLNYTKGLANSRFYYELVSGLVWRNNVNYGFVSSHDDSEPPFNELFLLGGANTLRGFDWFSIGKCRESSTRYSELLGSDPTNAKERSCLPFGGTQQLYFQSELQFSLVAEAGIFGVLFYDIGNADDTLLPDDFRSNVGFGFRWFSPIGPLRFEWGFPFKPNSVLGEDANNFEFAIGSPF